MNSSASFARLAGEGYRLRTMIRHELGRRSIAVALLAAGVSLSLMRSTLAQSVPESVYAPPELPRDDAGVNAGGVHFDLSLSYFTDYVYRGVEVFEVPAAEDSLNLQLETQLTFDLGKLPHPYVRIFVNVAEDDPISDFQEVRPTVGFDWTIKPLVIGVGHTNYIYPDRKDFETSELFLRVSLDDAVRYRGATLPSPYALAVYDYDVYDGLYLEAGVNYKIPFEEIGLAFTLHGDIGYVNGYKAQINAGGTEAAGAATTLPGFFTTPLTTDDNISGLQHWTVGVTAEYSLNRLFKVSGRYGEWMLAGYAFYTDGFDDAIASDQQIWGGAGITFRY